MSNTRRPKTQAQVTDFDAIRAKRARTLRQPPAVKIGGKHYTLAPTMPLAITDYFAEKSTTDEDGNTKVLLSDMQEILKRLFGDDQWSEIREVIDLTDVAPLFGAVFDSYREAVGESSNSGES